MHDFVALNLKRRMKQELVGRRERGFINKNFRLKRKLVNQVPVKEPSLTKGTKARGCLTAKWFQKRIEQETSGDVYPVTHDGKKNFHQGQLLKFLL